MSLVTPCYLFLLLSFPAVLIGEESTALILKATRSRWPNQSCWLLSHLCRGNTQWETFAYLGRARVLGPLIPSTPNPVAAVSRYLSKLSMYIGLSGFCSVIALSESW